MRGEVERLGDCGVGVHAVVPFLDRPEPPHQLAPCHVQHHHWVELARLYYCHRSRHRIAHHHHA